MSKVKTGVGAVMAIALIFAYLLAQGGKDKLDERIATVTVTWSPNPHPSGVRIVVRIAAKDVVKAKVLTKGTFTETYTVKPFDQVLLAVDPVGFANIKITGTIVVTGQEPVTNVNGIGIPEARDTGHLVCWTSVAP